jgi:DNA-binding response OmpR family regulator
VKALLLLVEDEPALARGLADSFGDEGFDVRVVARGDQALAAIREHRPQIVVLDILLPGRSGLDVLRDLRAAGQRVPVLMLTAKGDIVDRVVGLELGADDYLPKPFSERELLARVRALLRRAEPQPATSSEITIEEVRFDFRALTATGPQGRLDLTPHDILVLKVLAERRGEIVPRIELIEEVCGLDSEATLRTIDNHVVALRRAIGDDPRRPRWLKTVKGEGYRLAREDEARRGPTSA